MPNRQTPRANCSRIQLLSVQTKAAATEARDKEALLGEIPEEFFDPIQVHANIFGVYILDFEN